MDTMAAIKQTFFQECEEQLVELESGLLALDDGTSGPDTVNAVFRAVHSIKGGAGAFGLEQLVRFAHSFETALDQVRSGKIEATKPILKTMLSAADMLADLVRMAREDQIGDDAEITRMVQQLDTICGNTKAAPAPSPATAANSATVDEDFDFTPIQISLEELYVTTVGGVVKSGEPLAVIVPAEAAIAVEARISPNDRAEVWPGLPAVIKVSAYDFSVYGGLKGKVIEVSPDALQDERGAPYFRVRLEAGSADFGSDKPVVPGMVADVDILSGKRTIMDALLRPVRRLQENALRQ